MRWYLDGRSGRAAYEPGTCRARSSSTSTAGWPARRRDEAGRHPLPSPDRFADGMAPIGIGDGDRVIAYDDAGGVIAARLVWMLRVTGHEAALLDGGLAAWDAGARDRRGGAPSAAFGARPWPPGGSPRSMTRRPRRRGHRCAPGRALPRRAGPGRPALRPHPRRAQPALPREPRRATGVCCRSRSYAGVSNASALATGHRSSPTAARASRPVITCSRSNMPDSVRAGCSPAPGRRGVAIPIDRSHRG